MAKNPMFGNNVSPNSATAPDNPLNDAYKRYKRGYNTFDYGRKFFTTERYADINVIDVLEGVENDVLPLGNKHEIRSYTMNSPVMFDLQKKKSYFMVDNKAILPLNWEKVYKLPNKGDDVSEGVNCYSGDMLYRLASTLNSIVPTADSGYVFAGNVKGTDSLYTRDNYNILWRFLFLLESIYSDGSLLANMNCHLSSSLKVLSDSSDSINSPEEKSLTFDDWLETTLSFFTTETTKMVVSFPSISSKYFINLDSDKSKIYVSTRTIFDMMRTYPDFSIYFDDTSNDRVRFDFLVRRLSLLKPRYDLENIANSGLNLSRLIAYQLVCTQFYTKDSVDNVYNAELFMQNAKSIFMKFYNPSGNQYPYFTYNGVRTDYDVFSGHNISHAFFLVFDTLTKNGTGDNSSYNLNFTFFKEIYNYLHMIFFFRKSLRYGDYFVGAKTRPLAIGDVSVEVNNNAVSAVDITRNILIQRFKHAVERVPNTWKDYLAGVTDGVAAPKDTEPRFLASSTHSVNGFEVENTANEQGNIVTLLRSTNSNYVYEVKVGSPCIIIGVSTYQVAGVYSRTVDRFFSHATREDMFNKFMQNVGDQEITMNERSAAFSPSRTFGYTLRHMEYKQRYPICAGGFVKQLPGYAFIRDNVQSGQNDIDFSDSALHISPQFIRNRNSEFDRFYDSLSGLGLASYFHFIVKYSNYCNAKRQMEFTPTIL